MRSIMIVLVTIGLLVGGFILYWSLQPELSAQAPSTTQHVPASRPTSGGGNISGAGAGEQLWVEKYDTKTNELLTRFRAKRYDPQRDNTVNVTDPEAEFFSKGKLSVRMTGKDGTFVMSGESGKSQVLGAAAPKTPNRGKLHLVHILMFDAAGENVALTLDLNNASFDSETFVISTESFVDDQGQTVPADRVPVQVRGADYDFDGQGLTIRWNDRDHRLELLEIAHGKQLNIKHLGALTKNEGAPASQASTSRPEREVGDQTIAARAETAAPPPELHKKKGAASRPKPVHDTDPFVYRATFYDDVRILQTDLATQREAELARGDVMHVDFLPKEEKKPPHPTSAPAPSTRELLAATTLPVATSQPAAAPATMPSDQKSLASQGPVRVLWTGKMQVIPVPIEHPLLPGEAAITIEGDHVLVHRDQSAIECKSLIYQTHDASIQLDGGVRMKTILADGGQAIIRTGRMDYRQADQQAVLTGRGRAEIPQGKEMLKTDWSKSCTLHFSGQSQERLTITSALFEGDVDVEHPQMSLNSRSLELDFTEAQATTQPATSTRPAALEQQSLKRVIASGEVNCAIASGSTPLKDPAAKIQHIECEKLELATAAGADGKLYPSSLNAEGNVHVFDDQQDLKAGRLDATLGQAGESTSKPSQSAGLDTSGVVLKNLVAQQDVLVKMEDGTIAKADQITLETKDGKRQVKLLGRPNAQVISKQTTLTGPIITLWPDDQQASVLGAGTLHTMQNQAGQATAQPLDVKWDTGVSVDGSKNLIEVTGNVEAVSKQADGSLDKASAQKMTLNLSESPAASTKPTTNQAGENRFLSDREITQVTLQEKAEVNSLLTTEEGALLRRLNLSAATIEYHPREKRLVVPCEGRLLYEDHRKDQQSAPADEIGKARGAVAMEWKKEMQLDESKQLAWMTGDVAVVHQAQGANEPSFRLDAQKVTAELREGATTRPASQPSTSPSDLPRLEVRRVIAEDQVKVTAQQLSFEANRVEYDPQTDLMTATGKDRVPGELYDDKGASRGSFEELVFNTKTAEIKSMKKASGTVRHKF